MKRTSFAAAIVALSVLGLSACKKEPAVEPASPAAAPTATAPAADPALAAAANPVVDFDMRAFAGEFAGTLPCADCAGIDTKISLAGDGTYASAETYRGKSAEPVKSDGTWTAEDNGHRLRLDPNSKSEQDRLFEVVGRNDIRLMDKDGNPLQGAQNSGLKRVAAP
ncbi:copper resistance protein NlpE [Luteimonas gilva]|uniref:Copper resistance protein NlpE n=1 Tax=Luteimonas gilva TaxID=2572684 RepID=A0A4U5JZ86_9GAMM|nr:copper resistance protein NlpE [Luteimonas gilva]TKR33597.1 copper resistance protein NlpE [Luteimonas gilva]